MKFTGELTAHLSFFNNFSHDHEHMGVLMESSLCSMDAYSSNVLNILYTTRTVLKMCRREELTKRNKEYYKESTKY